MGPSCGGSQLSACTAAVHNHCGVTNSTSVATAHAKPAIHAAGWREGSVTVLVGSGAVIVIAVPLHGQSRVLEPHGSNLTVRQILRMAPGRCNLFAAMRQRKNPRYVVDVPGGTRRRRVGPWAMMRTDEVRRNEG